MPEPDRPNPDVLLARVNEDTRKKTRGHLKIFFGFSPGVGKTFTMLEAARVQKRLGVDVVAGLVETHARAETSALIDGLEVLPRRRAVHRGITIEEFDLDAAIARRPRILLVDELAHTNAPGSRHAKRWQDILELVDAGIDVYTTLNVQHLDALNDIVAQITGVAVRETVPDSVFDQADEVELVDLPVDELLARLGQGKVYLAEQAARARANFFRPGNLIALREMALRRTADRVDAQMRSYRSDHAIQSTWPVTGRLLVSIGPSPYSAKLIRAAKRMADRLQAQWLVAFVETPAFTHASPEVRDRVFASLRLAGQLGAETVTLPGADVARAVLECARRRNVTRIVIGKNAGPLWRRLWRGSILDDLINHSGDIEVTAISGEVEARGDAPRFEWKDPPHGWRDYAPAVAAVALATAVSLPLRTIFDPVNLVMVYLLGVVLVSMRATRRVALFASFLSVAAFDFFCIPPYLTFSVNDYEYLVTFVVMLAVAVIVSTLTVRTRQQSVQAAEREARTDALYRLTKRLALETQWFEAAQIATSITGEVFGVDVVLFFPEESGRISFRCRTTPTLPVPVAEQGIAQWVFDHGQKAGRGMDTLSGANGLYLPLKGASRTLGVMGVVAPPGHPSVGSPERQHMLEIFASQTALAIERMKSAAEMHDAQMRSESERLRSGLLSAVSHDLRTPLASIVGAASSLLAQGGQLPDRTREELALSVLQESERLSRLVGNLLEMTRLESGAVQLQKEWNSVEEIAGAALGRLSAALAGRAVEMDLPDDLPLVSTDDVLIEQLFINLLENAAKHTPEGTRIRMSARVENEGVMIEIADDGPGFAAGDENRVFEKFYRGQSASGRGAGLGLAICEAIVKAHRGMISAGNKPGGGAVVSVWLPFGGAPPKMDGNGQPN